MDCSASGTKKRRRLLEWEQQAIGDAYAAGEKIDAIAAEFEVPRTYPGRIAARFGHPRRRSGYQRATSNLSASAVLEPSPIVR